MHFRHHRRQEKIELMMTPMIDIVFQLNIFFLLTFKIILPEGDFNIRMPAAATSEAAAPSEIPTLTVRIRADAQGNLAGVQLGEVSFGKGGDAFARLHTHIRKLIQDAAGPGSTADQEVELDCDYDLRYAYVINAITAVSGYIEGGQRHQLIERIKFSPPRRET